MRTYTVCSSNREDQQKLNANVVKINHLSVRLECTNDS